MMQRQHPSSSSPPGASSPPGLRAELGSLKPRALYRRAEEVGVSEAALEAAEDGAAVIELIMAHQAEEEEEQRWAPVRSELVALRPRALQRRAEAEGVTEEELDAAADDAAIVALVLGRLQAARSEAAKQAERQAVRREALRMELQGLKPRALYRRAERAGVSDEALDAVEDDVAVIALILSAEVGLEAEPQPEGVEAAAALPEGVPPQASTAVVVAAPPSPGAAPPLNPPGHWDAMISYTQRHSGAKLLASEVYSGLEKRGRTAWLDVKMAKLNEAAMQEAAQNSRCIVAVISGIERPGDPAENAYFQREYCVNELRWARAAGVPIQPVILPEDKTKVGEFLGQAPADLKDLGAVDFIHLDRSRIEYWETGIDVLIRSMDDLAGAPPSGADGETEPHSEEVILVRREEIGPACSIRVFLASVVHPKFARKFAEKLVELSYYRVGCLLNIPDPPEGELQEIVQDTQMRRNEGRQFVEAVIQLRAASPPSAPPCAPEPEPDDTTEPEPESSRDSGALRRLHSDRDGAACVPQGVSAARLIFGSARLGNGRVLPGVRELQVALAAQGILLQIIDISAGQRVTTEVFEAIEAADTFLVFGTRDYGEDTGNPASTYYEAEFALGLQKRILLIRMCPWEHKFDHIMGRILFGMNRLTLDWQLGSPMPPTLPEEIVRALELSEDEPPAPALQIADAVAAPSPEGCEAHPEPEVEAETVQDVVPEPEPELLDPEPEPEPEPELDLELTPRPKWAEKGWWAKNNTEQRALGAWLTLLGIPDAESAIRGDLGQDVTLGQLASGAAWPASAKGKAVTAVWLRRNAVPATKRELVMGWIQEDSQGLDDVWKLFHDEDLADDLAEMVAEMELSAEHVLVYREQLSTMREWSEFVIAGLAEEPLKEDEFRAAVTDLRAHHRDNRERLMERVEYRTGKLTVPQWLPEWLPKWPRWRDRRRVTLCIGNDQYGAASTLASCVADATAMADMAREMREHTDVAEGYEIVLKVLKNSSLSETKQAVRRLRQEIWPGTLVTLYFSGHGAEHGGTHYLLPVGMPVAASLEPLMRAESLKTNAVSVSWILQTLNDASDAVSLLFLDCCRDNPKDSTFTSFAPGSTAVAKCLAKGVGDGLPVDSQFFVGLACDPGAVAWASAGEHSRYTQALLKHLPTPGESLQVCMERVAAEVWEQSEQLRQASGGSAAAQQRTWSRNCLREAVIMMPGESETTRLAKLAREKSTLAREKSALARDKTHEINVLQEELAAARSLPAPQPAPAAVNEEGAAAIARMQAAGCYLHAAFLPPQVVAGEHKGLEQQQRRLLSIEARLQKERSLRIAEGQYPIRLSDASVCNCPVELELRKGMIHTLVWCAKGHGFEQRVQSERVPSLDGIADIIRKAPAPPCVAVVCLQYGAQHAAKLLLQAGVPTVLWLTADIFGDLAVKVLCDVIMPALQQVHGTVDSAHVGDLLSTRASSVVTQTADSCGCCTTHTTEVIDWLPGPSADEYRWICNLMPPSLQGVNLDSVPSSLELFACDLGAVKDLKHHLQSFGRLWVRAAGDGHVNRCRAVVYAVCRSYLHDTRYEHVQRIQRATCVADMQSAEAAIRTRAPALLWLDLDGAIPATDLEQLCHIWQQFNMSSTTHVIVTLGDQQPDCDSTADLVENLEIDEYTLGERTGRPGVLADELYDEVKILAETSSGSPVCLLDVFEPESLTATIQKLAYNRPVVGIYRAHERNGVYVRMSFSDVGFVHALRDKILTGLFSKELQTALRSDSKALRKVGRDDLDTLRNLLAEA